MGVMINMLMGNDGDSRAAIEAVKGQEIRKVEMFDDGDGRLVLTFDENVLTLQDDGRSCCESRYMTTDDELGDFVGAEFRGVELRDGPELADEWGGPHEQQFLYVNTSIGTLVVTTHNEHNGYYGGFWIKAELTEREG
jgi:hypothetical protein